MVDRPIRTYSITVGQFGTFLYSARSRGKALSRCYRAYGSYDDRATFLDFLKLVKSVRIVAEPAGIGERAMVAGKPATRVVDGGRGSSNRLLFMYDGSNDIVTAHPMEVSPIGSAA